MCVYIYIYIYIYIYKTHELWCKVVVYFYHKISVSHDVRKNMDEWKRQQLLILDASFFEGKRMV